MSAGMIETFTCALFLRRDTDQLESRVEALKHPNLPYHLAMKEVEAVGVELERLHKEEDRYKALKAANF